MVEMRDMKNKDNDNALIYLRAKLASLNAKLHSNELYSSVASLNFGDADPYNVPLNLCENCGGAPQAKKEFYLPQRTFIICPACNRRSPLARFRQWEVSLEWNGVNLKHATLDTFPFFGIAKHPTAYAKSRLVPINRYLQLKSKAVNLQRQIPTERAPGIQYAQRLACYFLWSQYGLRLLKHLSQQSAKAAKEGS